eukprot:gene5657-7813_t
MLALHQALDLRNNDIFEALDNIFDSPDIFKARCAEISNKKDLCVLRDKRPGREGRTLLHNAVRIGSLPVVLSLLRLGHDIEPIDSSLSKITPLMDAITSKNIEIAIVLVEAGAKLSTVDVNGENAMHYCARIGNTRLLLWLVKAANLQPTEIQLCASVATIKRKFPEDLAINPSISIILVSFRNFGAYNTVSKKKTKKFNTND